MIRHRRPVATAGRERWLISYADFITLLLALFVVLFASSRLDKLRAHPVSPPPLRNSLDDLRRGLAPEIQAGKAEVHPDDRGLVISLRDAAYFPSGGDDIAPSEYDSLARIADTIRSIPNAVALEGHTDSTPIHNRRFRGNWELSAARSIAILTLFKDSFGLAPGRFSVTGYAETRPVDSNDSAEGRARNRRVDIVILNR